MKGLESVATSKGFPKVFQGFPWVFYFFFCGFSGAQRDFFGIPYEASEGSFIAMTSNSLLVSLFESTVFRDGSVTYFRRDVMMLHWQNAPLRCRPSHG